MRNLCLLLLCGCSASSSDVRPLESGLAAAVSLGLTSSLAMNAMSMTTVCASVKTACTGYPCGDGAVDVALGSGCPLPLGGEASGTVSVTGSWQSADEATLTNTFVDAKAGSRNVVVVSASDLTVSHSTNSVTVRYTWQNVNVQSGISTLSGQSSWDVTADLNNTPGDPSDDTYTVSGTDQGVSSQVSQISASDVVIKPTCQLTPVEIGLAVACLVKAQARLLSVSGV